MSCKSTVLSYKLALLLPLIIILGRAGAKPLSHKPDTAALFTDHGSYIELSNGMVAAKITKASAHITSYRFKNIEVLRDGYYSMDGGKGYAQPSHCEVYIKSQSGTRVDIGFKSIWHPGDRQQAFDIEPHYVIERGTAGIYAYAILTHQASYPKTSVGEWRFVWKLPQDEFDHIVVDSLRNMDMPTSYDYSRAEKTTIPESVKLTTGIKAGKYECKYSYSVAYYDVGTYGHTSSKNKIGAWMVLGGYDFFNDGPNQADLNSAAGIIHLHFGRDHYAGSGTSVEAGEQWSKIFGPYLLYLNTGNVNSLWADAKKRVAEEKGKWPYAWLTNTSEYPLVGDRGTAAGKFVVNDVFKPKVKGAEAWIGLTAPGVDFEKDSKNYQYWVKADAGGIFTIPNIRPGQYTLHAYLNGEVGEFSRQNVVVSANHTTNLGELKWDVPRNKGKLVWEIGIPDRSAHEFKFGDQYFNSFMWETYSPALANPLVYTVGRSNWHTDFNYVQSSYFTADGKFVAWPWKINFKLDKIAPGGNATLTFAIASAHGAVLKTFVNDDAVAFDTFSDFKNPNGNALVRQGIHAKYSTYVLKIPVSKLHEGDNFITLLQARVGNRTDHIMYDYISLEVPQ
jgi:rhamnogalacturonan endolyase